MPSPPHMRSCRNPFVEHVRLNSIESLRRCARLGPETSRELTHHDAGPVLAQLLWVLVTHTRPEVVIETGVARGVSSAYVLDAMAQNNMGHLWSIDLPPLGDGWEAHIGSAVPEGLCGRWTYCRGASRRLLPRILATRTPDIFVHDGLHTTRNMAFEFSAAWDAFPRRGLVSDDIDDSKAWRDFSAKATESWVIAEPGKRGAVGIADRTVPDLDLSRG